MASIRVPDVVPSPTQDSERLRKAFQEWRTDDKAIIWVLGHRNAEQRRKIREAYQQLYNESLVERLQSQLHGDYKNAVAMWTMDPAERDANLIREALNLKKKKKSVKQEVKVIKEVLKKKKKKGVEKIQVIVEIACSMSPHHLMDVRKSYCSLFDCSIEEDISSHAPPPLTKLLVRLVSSYRFDGGFVDDNVAKSEATKLREAIAAKQLDHDEVIWILSTRNVFQLKATFEYYRLEYGYPIDQDIEKCDAGDLGYILRVVIRCIDAPERHFAEVVKGSVEGLGTDEDTLTRVIVSRAEIDMKKIRGEFLTMNSKGLDSAVAHDTTGDYKDFLMTLLGARI